MATSAATLVTNPQGAIFSLRTAELQRAAYTVWWEVFDHPEHRTDPFDAAFECGPGDHSDALLGPGLTNPMPAEIHAVVRTHGPVIPGMVDEQIHTFQRPDRESTRSSSRTTCTEGRPASAVVSRWSPFNRRERPGVDVIDVA
ncbi:MAG: hypothetical protein M3276_00350 [Actinomycetota bacterium]|nr:hypothetical protein [Actinomycetota bacterium]